MSGFEASTNARAPMCVPLAEVAFLSHRLFAQCRTLVAARTVMNLCPVNIKNRERSCMPPRFPLYTGLRGWYTNAHGSESRTGQRCRRYECRRYRHFLQKYGSQTSECWLKTEIGGCKNQPPCLPQATASRTAVPHRCICFLCKKYRRILRRTFILRQTRFRRRSCILPASPWYCL